MLWSELKELETLKRAEGKQNGWPPYADKFRGKGMKNWKGRGGGLRFRECHGNQVEVGNFCAAGATWKQSPITAWSTASKQTSPEVAARASQPEVSSSYHNRLIRDNTAHARRIRRGASMQKPLRARTPKNASLANLHA